MLSGGIQQSDEMLSGLDIDACKDNKITFLIIKQLSIYMSKVWEARGAFMDSCFRRKDSKKAGMTIKLHEWQKKSFQLSALFKNSSYIILQSR